MIDEHVSGVEFISVNTDAQALLNNKADVKVQIGKKADARARRRRAAPRSGGRRSRKPRRSAAFTPGADLVFVTCGMGGGRALARHRSSRKSPATSAP